MAKLPSATYLCLIEVPNEDTDGMIRCLYVLLRPFLLLRLTRSGLASRRDLLFIILNLILSDLI